jgi:AcrR family transcriptional regulator
MQQDSQLADRILDTALAIAGNASWEDLQLHEVATTLDIPLDRIREYYAQKDDLAEAWFDRADRALLSWQPEQTFYRLAEVTRLQQVIMHWFDALALQTGIRAHSSAGTRGDAYQPYRAMVPGSGPLAGPFTAAHCRGNGCYRDLPRQLWALVIRHFT